MNVPYSPDSQTATRATAVRRRATTCVTILTLKVGDLLQQDFQELLTRQLAYYALHFQLEEGGQYFGGCHAR